MPAIYVVKHRNQTYLINKHFACTSQELPREIATHLGLPSIATGRLICLPLDQRQLPDNELQAIYSDLGGDY